MLKYYKNFFLNLLKNEFAESSEVIGWSSSIDINKPNYEKIQAYLDGNTEYKKEDMKDLWNKLSPSEQTNLQDIYKVKEKAKTRLTELTKEVAVFSELTLKSSLISETKKIDTILLDAKISDRELNNINYESVQNILSQAIRADFKKDKDFENKVLKLVESLTELNSMYLDDLTLVGSRTELVSKNVKFENFITNIQIIAAKEVENLMTENENLTAQPLDQKLLKYKELTNNNPARLLILKNIVENEVTAKNYRVWYACDETWKFWNNLTIVDNQNKEIIENEKINSIKNNITWEDLRTLELESVLSHTELDSKESINDRNLVETLLKKYGIEQGWLYCFEDIYDEDKKNELVDIITTKLNTATENKDITDLNFLLSYIDKPSNFDKKVFTNSQDLSTIGQVQKEIEKNPEDFIEAFKSWKWIKTILGDVMGSSGGPFLMLAAFIGLFMKEYRGTIFKTMLGLAGGMVAEEVAHKQGWTKWMLDWNNTSSDNWNGVLSEIWKDFNKYVTWPQITITNLASENEDNYNSLYNDNLQKLENKETSQAIEKKDFAQIYAQLVTAPKFNEMTIVDLKSQLDSSTQSSDILWTENVTDYKEGILETSGESINNNRTISASKVTLFLNMLVNKNDVWTDTTVADLFVQWWKDKPTEYISSEEFVDQNKNISNIFKSIPFSDPNKNIIKGIIEKTNEWTIENWKAKVLLGSKIEQIDSIITELTRLGTSVYVTDIIREYTIIKKQLDTQKVIDNFETKSKNDADLITWVSFVKDTANSITSWIALMVWYFNFNPSWVPSHIETATTSQIEALINTGKWILNSVDQDWNTISNSLTSKQKEALDEMIIELKEKKLTILTAKSQVLTGTLRTTNEELKNKTLADLLNTNSTEYKKWLDDIENNMFELKEKPAKENMEGYTALLLKNYWNVKALQEIISTKDVDLKVEWLVIKNNAKALLLNLNDYKANLDAYILSQKTKLSSILTDANNLSIASWDTTLVNIEELKALEKNKKDIEAEFINNGTLTDLIKGANQYILPSNGQITVVENVTTGLEDSLKTLDTTLALTNSGTVFETELDNVKAKLDAARISVETRVKISVPLPAPITDITKVQEFIGKVKEQDTLIDELSSTTKATKEQDREDIISNYINQLISELSPLNMWDEIKIAKLLSVHALVEKEIGNWWNNKFEKAYEENQEKIAKKVFLEGLKTMTIQSAPNEISEPFNKLLWKYADLNSWFNPAPANMHDLLDKLEIAKSATQTFLTNNPNDNLTKDKLNDIDYTINQILDILKGNLLTVEVRKYFKITSDTLKSIIN